MEFGLSGRSLIEGTYLPSQGIELGIELGFQLGIELGIEPGIEPGIGSLFLNNADNFRKAHPLILRYTRNATPQKYST